MIWIKIIEQFHHHAGKSEHRINRCPITTGHRRQSKESAEDIGRTINKQELMAHCDEPISIS